jgi:hypothetical protein
MRGSAAHGGFHREGTLTAQVEITDLNLERTDD